MLPNPHHLLDEVASLLTTARFAHTVRVVEQAKSLARLHGCNVAEAETAAILHDCVKDFPVDAQLKQAEAFGIVLADVERSTPALLHALVGAEVARHQFGINSEPVLNAIRWHTTGRRGMSTLEKVIFLADYTELGRQFSGVTPVRETAAYDLDQAMLLALDQTIMYVLQRRWLLHPATVEARNDLLL